MGTFDRGVGEHKKPKYKSFDCSIMELADDISYGIHDLEDSIALGLVTETQWKKEVVEKLSDSLKIYPLFGQIQKLTSLLFSGENKIRKSAISELVNHFIVNIEVRKQENFSHNLLDYQATFPELIKEELDIIQEFVNENVIKTPEVQTLEYKGQQMVVKLFEAISSNPSRLLPKKYFQQYEEQQSNLRVICDYLAGTTDDYATRLYHKIFTPSNGSIFDKL
jgi:dGTPase